jgi:hypothetical protein
MWSNAVELFFFFCLIFVTVYATLCISVIYRYKEWNVLQKIVISLVYILGLFVFDHIALCLLSFMAPTWIWANVGVLLIYSWLLYDLAFRRSTWTKTERKVFIIIWCIVMLFAFWLIIVGYVNGYFISGPPESDELGAACFRFLY